MTITTDRSIGRIGVCLDHAREGLSTLSWATDEALCRGAELTLCHPDRCVDGADGETAAVLRLGGRCDLMVVGAADGDGPRAGPDLPDAAARTGCPLVVVRPPGGRSAGPFAGHVVVAVDGTPESAEALRFGFDHAQHRRRPLAAVHVAHGPPGDYWFDDRLLETHFAAEPPALALLAEQVEPWAAAHPSVPVKRGVFAGETLPALRRAAAGAALLVVAHHPGGDPGKVCRYLARRAPCTVAIIPGRTRGTPRLEGGAP